MKENSPKEGELISIFPGIPSTQKVRLECGSYPKNCGFSVLAINSEEGENPGHYICTLSGNNNTPWCGASDLYFPETLESSK
jgi:hypothetical protein